MSTRKDRDEIKTNTKDGTFDRRSILLGGTTLAAFVAIAVGLVFFGGGLLILMRGRFRRAEQLHRL